MATVLHFEDEITVSAPPENRSARVVARLFFATFWLVTFTASIRKWVLPHASVLYLLQDVPILMVYLYAGWKGIYDRGYMFLGIALLSAVLILQGLLQIIVGDLSAFVAAVGIHNYLFYLPMLLVFPLCLTEKYRRDYIRWYLLLSIPMSMLAVAQAELPLNAFINQTSEGDAFGVPGAADVARVSGTFNFTYFYGMWVAVGVAFSLGEWLLPRERRAIQSRWLLALATICINLCHLVSASRQAIMFAAVVVLGGLICAIVIRSVRAIAAISGVVLLLPLAAGITYAISPNEVNIVVDRFTGKNYQEDGAVRIETSLYGFLIYPRFDLVGAGIGMGVDASHIGNAETYNYTYSLSETDTVRNVMELGTPVGLFYLAMRIGFAFGMVLLSFRIVRSGSAPHVLPLSFFLLADTYLGDLTRAATMTSTQVFLGYSFILGAYFYPDRAASLNPTFEFDSMRYA